jgi:hypothetical protein
VSLFHFRATSPSPAGSMGESQDARRVPAWTDLTAAVCNYPEPTVVRGVQSPPRRRSRRTAVGCAATSVGLRGSRARVNARREPLRPHRWRPHQDRRPGPGSGSVLRSRPFDTGIALRPLCGAKHLLWGLAMRILVCGGRDFNDREELHAALDRMARMLRIDAVIHGDARSVLPIRQAQPSRFRTETPLT